MSQSMHSNVPVVSVLDLRCSTVVDTSLSLMSMLSESVSMLTQSEVEARAVQAAATKVGTGVFFNSQSCGSSGMEQIG